MYATGWLQSLQKPAPFFEFVDSGHHVYLGNNRGNLNSLGHVSLDRDTDAAEYWDFSWADMAYDVYANVEAMYWSASNNKKGYYFGFSQGTI